MAISKMVGEDFQSPVMMPGVPAMPAIPPVKQTAIWDIGPRFPAAAPQEPDSTATPAQWLDYDEDVAHHVALVLRYRRERAEWTQKHGGGPIRLELDPVSAREALAHGAGRYVSSLPSGLMPGVRIGNGHG
jgi:hypothetical protein